MQIKAIGCEPLQLRRVHLENSKSIDVYRANGGYEALKSHDKTPGVGLTGVALIFAFVVGLASIHWLMRWLSNHSTFIFIYYRIAMGILLIVLLSTGVLHATR